jgi:hypothetical protein
MEQPIMNDLMALAGKWRIVSEEREGKKLSDEELKNAIAT